MWACTHVCIQKYSNLRCLNLFSINKLAKTCMYGKMLITNKVKTQMIITIKAFVFLYPKRVANRRWCNSGNWVGESPALVHCLSIEVLNDDASLWVALAVSTHLPEAAYTVAKRARAITAYFISQHFLHKFIYNSQKHKRRLVSTGDQWDGGGTATHRTKDLSDELSTTGNR